jgi:hypothetical protein
MVVAEVSPPARPGHDGDTTEEQSATQKLVDQGGGAKPAKLPASAGSRARGGGRPLKVQRGGDTAQSAAWHWQVMADFTGTGDLTTTTFRVHPQLKLRLRWTFRCAAGTREGTFGFQDLASITRSAGSLEETGTSGRGTSVVYPGGADSFLVVTSSCSWAVKAIQRS